MTETLQIASDSKLRTELEREKPDFEPLPQTIPAESVARVQRVLQILHEIVHPRDRERFPRITGDFCEALGFPLEDRDEHWYELVCKALDVQSEDRAPNERAGWIEVPGSPPALS